ncbi:MAG: peptidoglycan DD-metalloendopeptidase family protein [Lachnospiraceae bacterium]|jgi:murein DD-endopeptidase MepM/ murein hydrolase activator NlpD|nr:peptidoglycan DD-metalloendopeptidase family protein [Lachnospiraceae bacterium]
MGRQRKWTLTGLSVLLCATLSFQVLATKEELADAKNKMTALEQEKKKTEAVLQNLEALKSDAAAYMRQLDIQLESLSDELSQLEADITAKEERIAETKAELEEAKRVEKNQYESMKLRIKYMYEKGDSSYLDLLMESGSLSELLNRAEYITKISEYDRRQLDAYADTKERIEAAEAALEAEHAALLAMQEQTEAKHAAVEQLLTAKQKELSEYESRIEAAEGQLSEYQKDIEAQENAIKSIEAEIRRQEEEARKKAAAAGQSYKTISLGDIKFIWPCPSSGRITSGFGGRSSPTAGASSNHQGIDIGAPTGTDIVAAAAGEVVVSTYSYSAGNYVMLSHGGGVYTVYMHASKLLVSAGDSVKQGQVIAKVGSTGYSTGPHLHFGVRVNGTYVNPSQYVSP